MNKVMLVDDEKLILHGLLKLIEWRKLGLEVVHLSESGQDALIKFKEQPVDIVITDINMPKMTGLELIEQISNINENVKYIIVSGYDEFSYARTAIQYGVDNYILKPINEDELEDSLKVIINNINKEKDQRIFLHKNKKLLDLVNGRISSKDILKIEDYIELNLNNVFYTASNIVVTNTQYKDNMIDIAKLIKKNSDKNVEIIYKLDDQLCIINEWEETSTIEERMQYFSKIKNMLKNELQCSVFVAIGDIVNSIHSINKSYNTANELKKYILTKGTDICLSKERVHIKQEKNLNFTQEIKDINKLIIKKDKAKLKDYINKIFNKPKLTPKNIYDLSIKIIMLIDNVSKDFILDKYSKDSIGTIIVELYKKSTKQDLISFLIKELDELIKLIDTNDRNYSPVVQQIVKEINENYCEEMSLKTLSQKYNINCSYLGQIFSKEVGVSFSKYLNRTKNMKAKELILNTNMKINDVAKSVGYLDTSYFYKKFKNYYGVSPATLRELKNY